jgi:very-short-patch-repair endonuclease
VTCPTTCREHGIEVNVKIGTVARASQRGEVLVAIMNNARDWGIARDELWYRVPVDTAPKRWPPQWLAFYHTKKFGDAAYSIQYYGRVRDISVVERRVLFPHEPPNPKSDRRYYRVRLESLEELPEPIRSARWRRIVFIPSTWHKFMHAKEVSDLFDESPLEDRLWEELKRQSIPAERQWYLPTQEAWYALDFAVFCNEGNLDVETDGDTWHIGAEGAARDRPRDNAVQVAGWRVLRFNGQEIRESVTSYCLPKVIDLMKKLGGPADEGLVSRQFFNLPEGTAQQLTLFQEAGDYDLD